MGTTGLLRGLTTTVLVLAAGCGLPHDPEGTLLRVQGGSMRVGITEHPPWTDLGDDGPAGVEVDLAEGFARSLDARIEWFEGSEAELLTSLEEGELDLVVGGFTDDDAWAQKVTFTQPYAEVQIAVGPPSDRPPPVGIDGKRVGARSGTPVPGLVEDAGGTPIRVDDLSTFQGLVAAEDWELRALGRVSGGLVLDEARHAMAVPLGENAWLVRLERYLAGRAASVDELLDRHAER